MNFSDIKVKLAMIFTAAVGMPAVHDMTGKQFGAAVSESAPIAQHVLEAVL